MAHVIKRYANRKLYDCTAKRYIKLEELAELVKSGKEVKIIDNLTGEDITSVTLSKVLSEVISDTKQNGHINASMLREVLQKQSDAVVDYVKQGIEASVRTVKGVEQQLQQQIQQVQQGWKRVTGQEEASSAEDFKFVFQRMIEESVQFLITKMNLPTRAEISQLNQRLDEIEELIKESHKKVDKKVTNKTKNSQKNIKQD